jgi:streptogramin lyase
MRLSWAVASLTCGLFLSGCAGMMTAPTSTATTNAVKGASIKGAVHGGRSPIVGAHVYLYAAGVGGYGTASTSLLSNVPGTTTNDGSGKYYVLTDGTGSFSITGDYTCPASASQVYLYSIGGDAGGGSANSAAGLLAALGTCPASGVLSSSLFVNVSEISTVAMAYATAGYATTATSVASSGTALAKVGIANAFSTVTNLVDVSSGLALSTTPGGNGTVPLSRINTLGNILASCINSTGPASTQCTTLFANAKNGSTTPTDTATAMINIAHNPGANIANLYALQPLAAVPYAPYLVTQPNDFTIGIPYTGGGIYFPRGVAIDGTGNVWIANNSGQSVTELTTLGAPISGSSGFTGGGLSGPHGIAIDTSGNVWVTNNSGSSLSEFNSSGTALSGSSGITGGGLSSPTWIAIDTTGNLWINNNTTVSKFNSSGTAISGVGGYTGTGLVNAKGIGIDITGNVWSAGSDSNNLSKLNSSGTVLSGASGYTGGGVDAPASLAIDNSGNVWMANTGNNTLSEFNSSGTALSGSGGYTGGGLVQPTGLAIDGSGNVWTTNYGWGNLSEFNSSGSPISSSLGLGDTSLTTEPISMAIDGSGNIWVTASDQNVTEFIGLATPVVTPVVANRKAPYATTLINKP